MDRSRHSSPEKSLDSFECKGKFNFDELSQDDEPPKLIKLMIPEFIEAEEKKHKEKNFKRIDTSAPILSNLQMPT